jgi:hypothetical protein
MSDTSWGSNVPRKAVTKAPISIIVPTKSEIPIATRAAWCTASSIDSAFALANAITAPEKPAN